MTFTQKDIENFKKLSYQKTIFMIAHKLNSYKYFDNVYDKAIREKIDGVNKREKFRIRYYDGDTSYIQLEKKSKIDML